MKNIDSQYILSLKTLSSKYNVCLSPEMEPADVCGVLDVAGFEPLHPTISNPEDIKMWLIGHCKVKKKKNKTRKVSKHKAKRKKPKKYSGFYGSDEWRSLRLQVFNLYGKRCLRCGSTKNIHVDHIFPRSRYKQLELDIDNLQPLCKECNELKLNRSYWDYRPVSNAEKLKLLSKVGCDDLNISKPDKINGA